MSANTSPRLSPEPPPAPAPTGLSAAELYERCLSLDWPAVYAALDRLDGLTHAQLRGEYAGSCVKA